MQFVEAGLGSPICESAREAGWSAGTPVAEGTGDMHAANRTATANEVASLNMDKRLYSEI
jgi:hypothetical protein